MYSTKKTVERSHTTICQFHGRYSGECGYCKDEFGNKTSDKRSSVGMRAYFMSCWDYQDLIDLGWRRSGSWLYLPDNDITCCPQYTIRLDVTKFKPTKSQNKVAKKMQKFLDGDIEVPIGPLEDTKKKQSTPAASSSSSKPSTSFIGEESHAVASEPPSVEVQYLGNLVHAAVKRMALEGKVAWFSEADFDAVKGKLEIKPNKNVKFGDFYTNAANIICSHIRTVRKTESADDSSSDNTSNESTDKDSKKRKRDVEAGDFKKQTQQIAHAIVEHLNALLQDQTTTTTVQNPGINLDKIEEVPLGLINFYFKEKPMKLEAHDDNRNEHEVSSESKQQQQQQQQQQHIRTEASKKHKLALSIHDSTFDKTEFALYVKYQITVHKDKPDELTPKQYENFLCKSPLVKTGPAQNAPLLGFGSFHIRYTLDGKLIAVSVVDVLPSCLSSVYFFYDPDYHALSLGVYSVLREVELVKSEFERLQPVYAPDEKYQFKYYYMGYYIHTCPKMRYKGNYEPSDLLCPVTHEWVELAKAAKLLDVHKYCAFKQPAEDGASPAPAPAPAPSSSDDTNSNKSRPVSEEELGEIQVFFNQRRCRVKDLSIINPEVIPMLEMYYKAVGPELATKSLMYYIDEEEADFKRSSSKKK